MSWPSNTEYFEKLTGPHLSHTSTPRSAEPQQGNVGLYFPPLSPPPRCHTGAELMMDEAFDTGMLDMLLRVPTKDFPNKLVHAHPGPY